MLEGANRYLQGQKIVEVKTTTGLREGIRKTIEWYQKTHQ